MTGDGIKGGGYRWRVMLWGGAGLLLLAPLIAMRFTSEVVWTGSDFVAFGVMLAVLCGGVELAVRLSRNNGYRVAAGIALVAGFLMVWMNLAVGIIGNQDNPANQMFFGVLAVGLLGALIARFRAAGLARAMVAMAIAQGLVAVVAQIGGAFIWPL
ncbi:MAG: hypothetical protein HY859_04335, partial [Caulobacterales bacterium]|nr:hypothetical protein [Caulobacterales bacterium]